MVWAFRGMPFFIWMALAFAFIPLVSAVPDESQFPNISFKLFNKFVQDNFSSKITLSQVLLVLFTLTDNHDILNLHA
jgi:hypothetical protein